MSPPSRFSSTSSYVPRSQSSTVPAPYCALRDLALEARVVERVILDVDGQHPLAGLIGTPFGTAHEASAPLRSRRKS